MQDEAPISRRHLLSLGLGAGAGVLAGRLTALSAHQQVCDVPTPGQVLGPFFPARRREDEDVDLTRVRGRSGRANGEVLHVRGRVLDERCRPVEAALVEVWQANRWGRYDHERDASNPRPLDPNFQGWARVVTGGDGRFDFKTIKPGSYPANDRGWIRPPHIHFKVSCRGYHELVTQMYFEGEPLNEQDLLRSALSSRDQARVTVAFNPAPGLEEGARTGSFEITLRHVT